MIMVILEMLSFIIFNKVKRIVVLGDIHGDYDLAIKFEKLNEEMEKLCSELNIEYKRDTIIQNMKEVWTLV